MRQQGKAVGCAPPTALLFKQVVSIQDHQEKHDDKREDNK
jgi:hypothetical protein